MSVSKRRNVHDHQRLPEPPTKAEYTTVSGLERQGKIPFLQPVLPPKTPQEIRANGKFYFGQFSQRVVFNTTVLSLVLYDWSQPHFERILAMQSFGLVDALNVTLAKVLFDSYREMQQGNLNLYRLFLLDHGAPGNGNGNVSGNGSGSGSGRVLSFQQFYQQIVLPNWPLIQQYRAENRLIAYALNLLPSTRASLLYRGGNDNISGDAFFCRQFVQASEQDWFLPMQACIQKYFRVNNTLTTTGFWSTTQEKDNARRYARGVFYIITPLQPTAPVAFSSTSSSSSFSSTSAASSTSSSCPFLSSTASSGAHNISQFAIAGQEHLYNVNSSFVITAMRVKTQEGMLEVHLREVNDN